MPPDDDEQDDVLRVTPTGNLEIFDKAKVIFLENRCVDWNVVWVPDSYRLLQVRLYEIQTSAQTYCTDPDGSADEFERWKAEFDLESKKGDISELLVSVSEMRGIYTKLVRLNPISLNTLLAYISMSMAGGFQVPSAVSHCDFWQRYFYKVHQLECDEKRRLALKLRADQLTAGSESLAAQSWDGECPEFYYTNMWI